MPGPGETLSSFVDSYLKTDREFSNSAKQDQETARLRRENDMAARADEAMSTDLGPIPSGTPAQPAVPATQATPDQLLPGPATRVQPGGGALAGPPSPEAASLAGGGVEQGPPSPQGATLAGGGAMQGPPPAATLSSSDQLRSRASDVANGDSGDSDSSEPTYDLIKKGEPGTPGRPATMATRGVRTREQIVEALGGGVEGRQKLAAIESRQGGEAWLERQGYVSPLAYQEKIRTDGVRQEISELKEKRDQAEREGRLRDAGFFDAAISEREASIELDPHIRTQHVRNKEDARNHAFASTNGGPDGDLVTRLRAAEDILATESPSTQNYLDASRVAWEVARNPNKQVAALGRDAVRRLGTYAKSHLNGNQDVQGFLQAVADRKASDPTGSSDPLDTWKDVFESDQKFRSPAIQRFLKDSGKDVRAHVLGIDRNIPAQLDAVARGRVRAEHPDWQPNSQQFEDESTRVAKEIYTATSPGSTQQQKDQQGLRLWEARDALTRGISGLRTRLAGTENKDEQMSLDRNIQELTGHQRALDGYITQLGVQRPTAASRPTTTDLRTEMVGLQTRRDGNGPPLSTVEQQRLTALEGQFPVRGGRTATPSTWRPLTGDQETTVNRTVKKIQDDLTASGVLPNDKSGTDANGTPKEQLIADEYSRRMGGAEIKVEWRGNGFKATAYRGKGGSQSPAAPASTPTPAPRAAAPTSPATPPAGAALPPPPPGAKEGDQFWDSEGGTAIFQGGKMVRGTPPPAGFVFKNDMKIKNQKTGQTGTLHQGTPLPPGVLVLGPR